MSEPDTCNYVGRRCMFVRRNAGQASDEEFSHTAGVIRRIRIHDEEDGVDASKIEISCLYGAEQSKSSIILKVSY